MFDIDRIHEILVVLGRNKLRTALTGLGVLWGILMLSVMMGAGEGLVNGINAGFSGYATNSMFMWPRVTTVAHEGFQPGRTFTFDNGDVEAIRAAIPEIEVLAPRIQLGGFGINTMVSYKSEAVAYSIYGDEPDARKIMPLSFPKGRFINELDIKEKRKVAVIGETVWEDLYDKNENVIGTYIKIQGVSFKVIGVAGTSSSGERSERYINAVNIPLTTFQNAFHMGSTVHWLSITSKPGVKVSDIEPVALGILAERHHIHPDDALAFGHFNLQKQYLSMVNMFSGIRILIWVVGIGTLLAGVIGVSNIMLIIVKERTVELGIRRAIGATNLSIISQVISESVLLTSVAGIVGLLIGVWGVELLDMLTAPSGNPGSNTMFIHPTVDLNVILTALVVLVVAGALAGFIPAKRAVSIKPIDALRNA